MNDKKVLEAQRLFRSQTGARWPIICGAMFPCSHPRLVAAISAAGGLGEIQPLSFTYVHGYSLPDAIEEMKARTENPFGINILLESGTERYYRRSFEWLDIALGSGATFVSTALGKDLRPIIERAHAAGAVVYHKVTNERHAEIALAQGVDGIIAVNNRAGGHAGTLSAEELYRRLSKHGVPLVCAGGVGNPDDFSSALELGYAAVLMGTRFIATEECPAGDAYKTAIVAAAEDDIVLTERVTGVPLSVIKTPEVERLGYTARWWEKALMTTPRTKKYLRMWYAWKSGVSLKKAMKSGFSTRDLYQAGKSAAHIPSVESVDEIVKEFVGEALRRGAIEAPDGFTGF